MKVTFANAQFLCYFGLKFGIFRGDPSAYICGILYKCYIYKIVYCSILCYTHRKGNSGLTAWNRSSLRKLPDTTQNPWGSFFATLAYTIFLRFFDSPIHGRLDSLSRPCVLVWDWGRKEDAAL
jgi:hypothetical protein